MTDATQIFESLNPADGSRVGVTRAFGDADIEHAVERAAQCALRWPQSGFDERSTLLEAVADRLEAERDELARLVTSEMGKLIGESRAEVDKCAWVCRYYAAHAERFLAEQEIVSDAQRSLVAYQPLGVVLAVMPWNFPLWQVFRFAAPAIAAGNVGLLKHAANVMLCGAAIQQVFNDAGAPPGLFTHLPIGTARVERLLADPRVRAVSLTGSGPAGSAVAGQAGRALKKSVLELGGSDPFIVLEDADLELAVDKAVASRFMNAGQSCIAAKRFIVVEQVAAAFEQRLVEAVRQLRPGDPLDPSTSLGPMAREDLREEIHAQVVDAVERGARLLCGGEILDRPGWFYSPTVLSGLRPGMRAFGEELFGPVASILYAANEQDAVRLANDTEFGLGGSVWTADRERGLQLARQLDCGCAFVNELVKSDPRLPFGGIKASGYGRELGRLGIHEFVNSKTIWID